MLMNLPRALAHKLSKLTSGVQNLPTIEAERAALGAANPARPLRAGIIGLGAMGQTHARALRPRADIKLTALTSGNREKRAAAAEMGCQWYDTAGEMIGGGGVDVVVIATPHRLHAELAIQALQAGVHVVCEKPLALSVAQADAVLRVAGQGEAKLAVVFQSRFEPAYRFAKRLLDSGELGPVIRCEMVETAFRTQAYYKASPWRGTWKGEGGGVLVNQAPHVLDRYAWLCGMPERVTGFCATALHAIEVEDTFSAVFQHAGGAMGHVHVSTNECPAVSRIVIACDRGRIAIEHGVVRVERLKQSIRERAAAGDAGFNDIPSRVEHYGGAPAAWSPALLDLFYDHFSRAVADKGALPVDGAEAARSVELAGAIMLSSALGRALTLPLDRGEFDRFVAGKTQAAQSRGG